MDFDDRLRDQLLHQSGEIDVSPEGVDAIAGRVRARRQRRSAVAVTAAAILIAGLGGWVYGSINQPQTEEVATADDERAEGSDDAEVAATTTTAPATDTDATAQALPADETSVAADDPGVAAPVVRPEPGSPLQFRELDTTDAPGGYNVWQNGQAAGLYYVLSTGPGVTYDDLAEGDGWLRNDTLYTWDGAGWSQNGFGDRFVGDIGGGDTGLIYAVSTGSQTGGRDLELGTSDDGGATWSWTTIDLTAQFGPDQSAWPSYNVRTAGTDDQRLVVVNKAPGPDWEQGIELARAAGLDIDPTRTPIFDVSMEGIRYSTEQYPEPTVCQQAFSEYIDSAFMVFEEAAAESGEPLDEEDYFEFENRYAELEQEALAVVAEIEGCAEFVECHAGYAARNTASRDAERAAVEAMGIDPDTDYWEGLTEEQFAELDAALQAVWDEQQQWLDESGCNVIMWGPIEEFEEGEGEFSSWAELGVTVPDAWAGATHAYLVEDGEIDDLGPVFGTPGFLVRLDAGASGYEVRFDNTTYSPDEPFRQDLVVWSSTDGRRWASATADESDFYTSAGRIGGMSLSLSWESEEGPDDGASILRTSTAGTARLRLVDLAPDLDTNGFYMNGLKTGEYGAVAWAVNWESPESRQTIVVYSPDGIAWGAALLDGVEIVDMIVGADGVMAFGSDPDRVGSGTAQPVLFGR